MLDLSLSRNQIILGGLLGDSSFYYEKRYVSFSHSEGQLDYLKWKAEHISPECANNIKKTINRWNGKEYNRYYFYYHIPNGDGDELRQFIKKSFYSNDGRKKVSIKGLNELTPLALAIWWMDDGSMCLAKNNRYGKLSTNCFNYEEHILLQKFFFEKYGIRCLIKKEKGRNFLRFNVESLKILVSMIYPYVCEIPSMVYKIDLQYKNLNCIGENFTDIYNYIKSCYDKI